MGALRKVLVNAVWSGLCVFGCYGFVSVAGAQTSEAPQGTKVIAASASGVSYSSAIGAELPDSPGAILAEAGSPAATFQAAQNQQQPTASQPGATQTQQAPQKPVGTAAAEAPKATGVAASQPAGVAIAPGKQHRARTIVIRVGAILGAAAAVGTVVALTAATPSKPPGAH